MPPGNTNSSAHPGGNANTSTPDSAPVGGDAERVEQKILAGQPVSAADLTGLPKLRLRLLRNTVYARHGRIFDSPELRVYFARQSWYQPRPDYKDTLLTATDKTNVETILALENRSR
jgi:serine/threonine-protein kinase